MLSRPFTRYKSQRSTVPVSEFIWGTGGYSTHCHLSETYVQSWRLSKFHFLVGLGGGEGEQGERKEGEWERKRKQLIPYLIIFALLMCYDFPHGFLCFSLANTHSTIIKAHSA